MVYLSVGVVLLFAHYCFGVDLETLQLVSIVFRHGDRNPEMNNLYPGGKNFNESNYGPYGYGQLTKEGMRNTYNLGKEFRDRYDGFLSDAYNIKLIEGRSSDFNRTKASMQLVLSGLFPPNQNQSWSDLAWLPIPYNYVVREKDKEIFCFGCPNWDKTFEEYLATEAGKQAVAQFKQEFEIVNNNTGQNITDILTLYYYYFGLEIQKQLGMDLDDWVHEIYPDRLKEVVTTYYASMLATKSLKQMAGGYLLKKIIKDNEEKINDTLNPSERKMFLYSAHENNVASILEILGVWDNDNIAPYNSYVSFELHNVNGEYAIQVFYKGNTTEPVLMNLPNCTIDDLCPFDTFKAQISDYITMDDSVCGEVTSTDSSSVGLAAKTFVIIATLMFVFNL